MSKSLTAVLFSCVAVICLSLPSSAQAKTCNGLNFSGNQVYESCNDLPVLTAYIYWNYHQSNMTADIAFRKNQTSTANWVAWALNPGGQRMLGSQAIVAFHNSSGIPTAYTTSIDSYSPSLQPGNLSFPVSNIRAEYSNNEMIIFATLQLDSNLISTNQVWQVGPMNGNSFSVHSMSQENLAAVGTINFANSTTTVGATAPSSSKTNGANAPSSSKNNAHGVLNGASWGILLLAGIMAIIVI